jgi:hypothetical protein
LLGLSALLLRRYNHLDGARVPSLDCTRKDLEEFSAVDRDIFYSAEQKEIQRTLTAECLFRGDYVLDTSARGGGEALLAVRKLMRHNVLRRPQDAILAVLNDEEALKTLCKESHLVKASPPRQLTLTDRVRQLNAALPLRPALAHWAIVGATSVLMVTLLFIAASPLPQLTFLSLPIAAWLGCLGLTTLQHLYRPGRAAPAVNFAVTLIVMLAFGWFVLTAARGQIESRAIGFVATVVAVLFLTNGLSPEIVDRWRGAGLTYPTRGRLWAQRALWLALGSLIPVLSGVVLGTWPLALSIALPFAFAVMRLSRGWSVF